MYRLATLTTLALAFFITAVPSLAQQARFERLGAPSGSPQLYSEVFAGSDDGTTAVGWTRDENNTSVGFRWQDGEMEVLPQIPDAPGGSYYQAWGVSADGSVAVGRVWTDRPSAVRWENGEIRVIHDPERCSNTSAWDVSADGSIVVGDCSNGESGREAVRWVDGEMEGLGWLPDATSQTSYAFAVTSDGSFVVGTSSTEVFPIQNAFRWSEEGGMERLCGVDQPWCYYPRAVTPDGSVIVGDNNQIFLPSQAVAWRWEEGVGVEQLALPEGWVGAFAYDVSADGSIIVGRGFHEEDPPKAFIWTEDTGVRDLKEVLENDFGLDMSGWGEVGWGMIATGISDDGTVIVGSASNAEEGQQEGFRVEAPFGQPVADQAAPEALADVLSAPSPNPASGTSTFTIAVEHGQHVAVEVFDALGRQVQTVYDGTLPSGMSETLTLDASALPAGVYLIRATGEDFVKTRNVTVVR